MAAFPIAFVIIAIRCMILIILVSSVSVNRKMVMEIAHKLLGVVQFLKISL